MLSLPNLTLIDISSQIPFLIRALSLGLSHLPTAKAAIATMERWTMPIKKEFLTHLKEVLPYLSDYLLESRRNDTTADEDDDYNHQSVTTATISSRESVVGRAARAKRRRERQKRKTAKDGARSAGWISTTNDDDDKRNQSELEDLHQLPIHVRIIRLLGRLGGKCHHLVNDTDDALKQVRILFCNFSKKTFLFFLNFFFFKILLVNVFACSM